MNSKFLKYYNKIILQTDQSTGQIQQTVSKSKDEINMSQKFYNAMKEAQQVIENCNKDIANAAYHQINDAYNNNEALFDDIQKKPNKNQPKKQQKTTPTTNDTTIHNTMPNSTASTASNPNTNIKQSAKLSNKFNEFYNLVFEQNNQKIIQEAKTEDVYSDHYVLIVNDDKTFKLVNDEDTDTKFSIQDYKKVNKWIQTNQKAWMNCVSKFGGAVIGIDNQTIDNALNNFKDINGKPVNNKEKIKQILQNIKNSSHFSKLSSLLNVLKKKEGYLNDDKKSEIKTAYLMTLIYIINATWQNAPNKAKRAKNAQEKKKKNLEEQKRNKSIKASEIMQSSTDKDPDLKSRKQKLYKVFIIGTNKAAALFNSITTDLSLNNILCQGIGDADDQQLQYSQNRNNDSWKNCNKYKNLQNNFIDFLCTSTNFDSLQTKITAIAYMKATIEAKIKAQQYTKDDGIAKKDIINKFIDEIKKLLLSTNNKTANIQANWDFNFNLQNKNTIQQILQLSKR